MKSIYLLTLAVLASALIAGYVHQSEALPSLWSGVACAKDYMVNLVRDKVISKSTLVRAYNETMTSVKRRYEEARLSGQLDGKDEQERENVYYKIAHEELQNLKSRIESGSISEQSGADAETQKSVSSCVDPDAMVENWNPDAANMDEEDERELLAELEDLENMAKREDEMGWSLSDEARAALKSRTKEVLTDLINNEVRQIAMAVLSAYLSGGTIMPTILALSGGAKYKLADFFMNMILDLVSYAMGRKIEIRPAPSQAAIAA